MSRAQGSVLILAAIVLTLFIAVPEVPLLGFAGALVALALSGPAGQLVRWTGMPRWAALLLVVAGIGTVMVLVGMLAADPLARQARQLAEELPASFEALRERISRNDLGAWLADEIDLSDHTATERMGFAATAASTTLGWLGNIVIIVLVGVYLAVHPASYVAAIRALLHPSIDAAGLDTLRECCAVLRGWLAGKIVAMAITGIMTYLGLWMLGLPLAGVLAVLAALLGFIPNIGPVLAAIPAILLAITISPWMALWVALLFTAIQFVEGNILTPLVQSELANLPPAALLLAQVLMASFYGLLGIALAAPLAAVATVLVRRSYAEGWLGRSPPPG